MKITKPRFPGACSLHGVRIISFINEVSQTLLSDSGNKFSEYFVSKTTFRNFFLLLPQDDPFSNTADILYLRILRYVVNNVFMRQGTLLIILFFCFISGTIAQRPLLNMPDHDEKKLFRHHLRTKFFCLPDQLYAVFRYYRYLQANSAILAARLQPRAGWQS